MHYQIIHSRITGNKLFSLISGKAGYSTLKKSTYRIKFTGGFLAQLVVLIDGLYTILSSGGGVGEGIRAFNFDSIFEDFMRHYLSKIKKKFLLQIRQKFKNGKKFLSFF